ncbi:MAG: alpha-ketoacid dehydrogenase subunit beta [Armatimonadota bacterium]
MSREIYYSHAIREALAEELRRDERVLLIGEDIAQYGGAFKVTEGFLDEFGAERVIRAPISENSFIGVAIGAALTGMRPVAEIMFMDFITLAMDQLVNHAAKFRYMYGEQASVPLVVRCPAGAGRGYGPSHSQSLERWFVATPGLKVAAPATAGDAKGMLKAAIRDDDPVIFVESKLLYGRRGEVPDGDHVVPLGSARVARDGTDVAIIAYSRMVEEALRAAEALAESGISAEVVDLRSLAPLDMDTMALSVEKCGRVVVAEEGHLTGGVGAEVAARIMERCFDLLEAPIRRVAALDVPVPASVVLEQAATPDWEDIGRAAAEIVQQY